MTTHKETRIYILDLIKSIAILMVVITHLNWSAEDRLRFGFPYHIAMAVPIFMLVSGYVSSASMKRLCERKHCSAPDLLIDPVYLLKSFARYLIPFAVVFAFQMAVNFSRGSYSGSVLHILKGIVDVFLTGGAGPGGYYVPILIQYTLVIPLIDQIIRKYSSTGLLVCFGITLFFELIKTPYGIDGSTYRLLVLRYVFTIACGCYLGQGKSFSPWVRFLFWGTGFLFIWATHYGGIRPRIFDLWTGTSAIASLYVVPIFDLLIKIKIKKQWGIFRMIGASTYNIFLVQMEYYLHFYRYDGRLAPIWNSFACSAVFSVLLCVSLGIALTYLEKPLIQWVIKKIDPAKS